MNVTNNFLFGKKKKTKEKMRIWTVTRFRAVIPLNCLLAWVTFIFTHFILSKTVLISFFSEEPVRDSSGTPRGSI